MPDFEFQPYLDFVQRHYSESQGLYTPTDAVLPLKVQSVEKDDRVSGEQGNDQKSSQKLEQFLVLDGLRKYALGDDREHVLLAGRPGSGKSMALRQLVVALASEGQVPVLVQLKGDRSVSELIKAEFRRAKVRVTDDQIDEWLFTDRLVLLLDGVNEIPTEKLRQDLAQFREDNLSVPMVFTTRDLGIGKRFEMKPLSPEQLREFVGKYLPGQGERLLKHLSDRLREISETPLLLKMLCDVFDPETDQIPQNKGELFREFDRKYDQFKGLPAVSADFRRFKSEVLQHLAFVMMTGDEGKPTELELTIDRQKAEKAIEDLVTGRISDPGAKAKEWLEDLLEHHLLQVATDDRRVEFRHQLFQEYYAAEALLVMFDNKHPDVIEKERFQHLYLNYLKWTETITIVLSLMKTENAVDVVKWALVVDLILGARLAGEVRSDFQGKTVGLVSQKSEENQIPYWLRMQLFPKIELSSKQLEKRTKVTSLNENDVDICICISELSEILENECSHRIYLNSIEFFIAVDRKTCISTLIRVSKDSSKPPEVRFNALSGIGYYRFREAIPDLIPLINDKEEIVRFKTIQILGRFSALDAVPELLRFLAKSDNSDLHHEAIMALGNIACKDAVQPLINILNSNNNNHLYHLVIEALGNIKSEDAVDTLIKILTESKDHDLECYCVEALGKIGSCDAICILEKLLSEEINLIKSKSDRYFRDPESEYKLSYSPVAQVIESNRLNMKWTVIIALGRTGSCEVLPLLKQSFKIFSFSTIVSKEAYFAIHEIQSKCKFYNYKIEQQAKLRKADRPSLEGGGGDRSSLPATITYNVKELNLVSEQQPIFNQYNPTIGVNYAAENSNPRIIQNIQQESQDTALLAIVQIIQALEKKYTFVQDQQQAIDIIDAEFKSLEAVRSPQWQNLLNVKRLYNGGKKAAVKVSEHFAQENVWGKGFVAFLEGVSEDVK